MRWQLSERFRTFSTEDGCDTAVGCAELMGYSRLATRGNDMDDISFMEAFFELCLHYTTLESAVTDLKRRIEWGYMWRRC